ncbi:MAG: 4Fe-4S dicluster domain-containing protein [Thermoplasmata archaeon]|nr:MAG: 4Fe-4S dicluster domain-containing protein [Thermoplasmata archaeon]
MAKAVKKKAEKASEENKIPIYIMGKRYLVPDNLTIMKAMEFAGLRFIRGCGCRGGFCGACGTVYRTKGDYKLKAGLACQSVVEEDMYLTQMPFFPANKAVYDLEALKPTAEEVIRLYPEIFRCVSCNTCTKICPQEIEVMNYVNAALRGDISKTADLSFDCIMCGLCAARCPAEIVQYNVAILCRRLYARHIAPKAGHLQERVKEIEDSTYDAAIEKLISADEKTLRKLYNERDIEPA